MRHYRTAIGSANDIPLDGDPADAAEVYASRGKHVFNHVVLNRRAGPAVLCIRVNHAEAFSAGRADPGRE